MRAAAELQPGARYLCIEGAGHAPFISHAEDCLRAILEFVDALG
jgi:pimeloyl-[acyl-carrier protein] methyl ester esterase